MLLIMSQASTMCCVNVKPLCVTSAYCSHVTIFDETRLGYIYIT